MLNKALNPLSATSLFCESIRLRSHTVGFANAPTDVRGPRSARRPTIASCGSPAGSTSQLRCITSQVFSPRLRSWRGSQAQFVVLQIGLTDTTFLLKAPCLFFVLFFNFYWNIVDLRYGASFRCIPKSVSYTYTYIHSFSDSFSIQVVTEY